VRGSDGSEIHFDGVNIAQNDFFYTFNARLTRSRWRVAVEAVVIFLFCSLQQAKTRR
jgi:hypothetical protein